MTDGQAPPCQLVWMERVAPAHFLCPSQRVPRTPCSHPSICPSPDAVMQGAAGSSAVLPGCGLLGSGAKPTKQSPQKQTAQKGTFEALEMKSRLLTPETERSPKTQATSGRAGTASFELRPELGPQRRLSTVGVPAPPALCGSGLPQPPADPLPGSRPGPGYRQGLSLAAASASFRKWKSPPPLGGLWGCPSPACGPESLPSCEVEEEEKAGLGPTVAHLVNGG
ncbi:PREDICTED: uncharacterized protein LOC102022115 isoform X2 [Chinchilla lanigera]|uniref:uncharacterized protein LOC102022115 isoform X2 n=1 Tax=Chinchilla lanigera TaxID=34839 RepID=UPI000698D19D|nr:PREDICTED: uncharacterized protein LOC102022115 isoform X2 [Chinchilla lanigera]